MSALTAARCRRMVPSLVCLVATCPVTGWAVTAPSGPTVAYLRSYYAPFRVPTRIAVDTTGNVYVTDPGQGQVIVRAPNGRVVSRGRGLGRPLSVAAAADGSVYVGDSELGSVTAFGPDWQPILQMGAGAGEFRLPNDLAIDPATGNLYVADSAVHQVKVYSATGVALRRFGGQGSGDGQFNFPVSVSVDAVARRVLVVDQLNYRLQVFDTAGTFVSSFGTRGNGPGQFNMPQGVAVDAQGRVYVADSLEGRIQVLDGDGNFVGFIADFGEAAGQLRIPMDVVIDPANRLFVTAANNARLEMFGLDAFTDPETITPALVQIEPNPIERASAVATIVGYLEIPAYPLGQIVADSIRANGISPKTTQLVIGDHDGNGTPDARLEFDRTALLATLPAADVGTIVVSGTIADKRFEADGSVQITTCGVGATCSLGDADAQCNDALCVAPAGCTIQPKTDGTGCEDGDACTVGDACQGGACIGVPLSCNDGNPCTNDSCDPVTGCVRVNNTAPCDDGSACTTDDTCADGHCNGTDLSCDDRNACTDDSCDPVSGCLSVGNTMPCDDGDPGTVSDRCAATGTCTGRVMTGNYALLGWLLEAPGHRAIDLSPGVVVRGDICGERIAVGAASQVEGDAIASAARGWAIMLASGGWFQGDIVTDGGKIIGLERVTVDGRVDASGGAAELVECAAARYRARSRWEELAVLLPSPGLALGPIHLGPGTSLRIPTTGSFGAGRSVVELGDVRLGGSSTVTLVGRSDVSTVLVHVRGRMMLGQAAQIRAEGLLPEQVLFVVDGSVNAQSSVSVVGSIIATGRVHLGPGGTIAGALLGPDIDLAPSVMVDLHPFVGW